MKSDVPSGTTGFCARRLITVFALILVGALSGCAHTNPRDPFESFNRGVYAFNDALDTAIIKPVATGYTAALPQLMRTGISNFFSNLNDITVILNGVLQLKITQAVSDTGRFLINSTIGLLGFVDVATHLGLEKHNEDFGQTLGYWGIGSGPYLVLPFIGPSSVRDGIGFWIDYLIDPVWRENNIRLRNSLVAVRFIDRRAQFLDSEKLIDTAAIDRYSFLRDAYLQRRRNLVYDGNPPPEPEDDEINEKPKPSSQAPAIPPAVLVDQFGNVVAGAVSPASERPAPAQSAAPPTRPEQQAESAAATPAASNGVQPHGPAQSAVPAANDSAGTSRIVRVWLAPGPAPSQ